MIAMFSLSACAMARSKAVTLGPCPPVIAYSRDMRARVADDLALLPEGSAIAEMLADYNVMREQTRACTRL